MTDERIEWLTEHLQTLRPEPGDKFILTTDCRISEETARRMKDEWSRVMKDYPLIIIADGIKVGLVKTTP